MGKNMGDADQGGVLQKKWNGVSLKPLRKGAPHHLKGGNAGKREKKKHLNRKSCPIKKIGKRGP